MNTFQKLLIKYPTAPWDWDNVSLNPSINVDFIKSHPSMKWNFKYISRNANISEQDIKNNPTLPWNYETLCYNPNLSMSFINEYIIKPKEVDYVNWKALSANKSITMNDIQQYVEYPWVDKLISANPNLSSSYILHEGKNRKWYIPFVCSNSGITESDILKSRFKNMFEFDYLNLSANPNLPIVFVSKNLDKKWNYNTISAKASLTDITTYSMIPWDANGLSQNKSMTIDYVKTHPDIKWDIKLLLMSNAITLDDYQTHYKWFNDRWYSNSERPEQYLSGNININCEWVQQNQNNIDWSRLSKTILQN